MNTEAQTGSRSVIRKGILLLLIVTAIWAEWKLAAVVSAGGAIHNLHGVCNGGVGRPYGDFIHHLRTMAESGDTNRLVTVLRRADEHSRDIYDVWLDDNDHDAYRKSIAEILK
jgi:hypothetical protein